MQIIMLIRCAVRSVSFSSWGRCVCWGFFIVSVSDGLMQIWCGYANEVVTRVFLPLWPGHLELGAKINESLIRGKWATVQSGANGFKRGPISSQILKSGIRSNNLTNSGANLSPWFKSGVVFKKSRSMQMRRLMPWWRYPPIRAPNQKATISNGYANLLVV